VRNAAPLEPVPCLDAVTKSKHWKVMAIESTLRKPAEHSAASYRAAPHNIEAEQALLGAILVNNEALYRVSDFLEPQHFFEPIHQQI